MSFNEDYLLVVSQNHNFQSVGDKLCINYLFTLRSHSRLALTDSTLTFQVVIFCASDGL